MRELRVFRVLIEPVHNIIQVINIIRLYRNWGWCLLSYFQLVKHREITYVLRNGIRFVCRPRGPGTIHVINDIWLREIYTPLKEKNGIQRGCTVVDIGAHIGIFSVFAATRAEHVRVYSYEPSYENFHYLSENIKLNMLGNIKAFQLAVSSGVNRKVKLYLDEKSTTEHSIVFATGTYEEVDAVTLEDVLDKNGIKNCDLLKMDCEGAEYEILFNTPKNTLMRIRNIVLEWHNVPTYRIEDLKRYLEIMGFDVWSLRMPFLLWRVCVPLVCAKRRVQQ